MAGFLGTDEIDFERAAASFPDISLDGEGDIPSIPVQAPPLAAGGSGFSFDSFGTPPLEKSQPAVKVTGDDEIEKFESEFPEIDVGPKSPPVQQSTFAAAPTFAPRPQQSAFSSSPILNQTIEEDEPEVIKQWRQKQAEEIKARDEASKARRAETINQAEKAIDEFYDNYKAKKERTIAENKENEEAFLQSLTDSLSAGTTWERICDFVELQNSQSKTIARTGPGTTDLTRFKEVLLRLKREGATAPGAGGY